MLAMKGWLVAGACLSLVAPMVFAAPDYWDPRLNQICQLFLQDVSSTVPSGQGYWRLSRGVFENEQESGGNHNVFYKALDVNGNPIENQKTWVSWSYTTETDFFSQPTKGSLDGYWGNYPMYGSFPSDGCGWPYNAWIDTASSPKGYLGPSDKVWGMGMTDPGYTLVHAHVNFRLTWQWTIKTPPPPAINRSPASFSHTITAGDSLANDSFTVYNGGSGTLNYSISDNATWLNVNPASGTSTGLPANSHQVI